MDKCLYLGNNIIWFGLSPVPKNYTLNTFPPTFVNIHKHTPYLLTSIKLQPFYHFRMSFRVPAQPSGWDDLGNTEALRYHQGRGRYLWTKHGDKLTFYLFYLLPVYASFKKHQEYEKKTTLFKFFSTSVESRIYAGPAAIFIVCGHQNTFQC